MKIKNSFPAVTISQEMFDFCWEKYDVCDIERTIASKFDTEAGIYGELVWPQLRYGDWRKNNIGLNKGKCDFKGGVEVKGSAYPFHPGLNLLVREEYAARIPKPLWYVQVIIDIPSKDIDKIMPGTVAYICGYATVEELDAAPKKDFGTKDRKPAGYLCHYIPIIRLKPAMDLLINNIWTKTECSIFMPQPIPILNKENQLHLF